MASLSDLVAFGEMSYSGRVPSSGVAGGEVEALIVELRGMGWIPSSATPVRNGMGA